MRKKKKSSRKNPSNPALSWLKFLERLQWMSDGLSTTSFAVSVAFFTVFSQRLATKDLLFDEAVVLSVFLTASICLATSSTMSRLFNEAEGERVEQILKNYLAVSFTIGFMLFGAGLLMMLLNENLWLGVAMGIILIVMLTVVACAEAAIQNALYSHKDSKK